MYLSKWFAVDKASLYLDHSSIQVDLSDVDKA